MHSRLGEEVEGFLTSLHIKREKENVTQMLKKQKSVLLIRLGFSATSSKAMIAQFPAEMRANLASI